MPGTRGPVRADAKSRESGARGGAAAGPKQAELANTNPLGSDLVLTEWPEPPAHVGEHTIRIWNMLGTSLLAGAVDLQSDFSILERWATYVDRWFALERRLRRLIEADRDIVIGSTGQEVPHPLYKMVKDTESMIRSIEKDLGISPMARARLGLTVAEGQLAASQLNEMVKGQLTAGAAEDVDW
jgi:P27 family predicted phage terminase small subunit